LLKVDGAIKTRNNRNKSRNSVRVAKLGSAAGKEETKTLRVVLN
jgi:hypothetical protein